MSGAIEVRMPDYPECWQTCGSCAGGDVSIQAMLVKAGEEVGVDDTLLVLETGKVALDLPSPLAGRVVAVFVQEGDAVAEGQLLLTIDPS